MISNFLLKGLAWMQHKQYELAEARESGDEGQGVVEYVLVLGVIVVGIILLWQITPIDELFQSAYDAMADLFA